MPDFLRNVTFLFAGFPQDEPGPKYAVRSIAGLNRRNLRPSYQLKAKLPGRIDRRLRRDREHVSIFGAGTVTQRHDQTAARAYHARKVGQGKLSCLIVNVLPDGT